MRFLLGGALGLGFFTVVGSVAPAFWVYAAVLVPVGLAIITFLNSCNTSIQLSVEPQFRGGVLALYLAILQGGTAVGAPLMGWIGTDFGPRWSVAAGNDRTADGPDRDGRSEPKEPPHLPGESSHRVHPEVRRNVNTPARLPKEEHRQAPDTRTPMRVGQEPAPAGDFTGDGVQTVVNRSRPPPVHRRDGPGQDSAHALRMAVEVR